MGKFWAFEIPLCLKRLYVAYLTCVVYSKFDCSQIKEEEIVTCIFKKSGICPLRCPSDTS